MTTSTTFTIALDADKTNIGSVSIVFADADGTTFSYSGRCQTTGAAATAFIQAYVSARNAWQSLKTAEQNLVSPLTSIITSNDTQAGTITGKIAS